MNSRPIARHTIPPIASKQISVRQVTRTLYRDGLGQLDDQIARLERMVAKWNQDDCNRLRRPA